MASAKSTDTPDFRNTIKMTLTTNGELGVGVIDPTYRITSSGVIQARSVLNKTIGGATLIVGTSVWNGDVHLLTGHCSGTNTGFIQVTNGDGSFNGSNIINSVYNLTLQPQGGNVGIGVQNASWKLQIAGQVAAIGPYSIYSDRREKENIDYAFKYGLETIKLLKPVKFDYINYGKNNLGFIAQDLVDVIPEMVASRINEHNEERYFISESCIIPILVKSIQEQSVIIDDLQKQLNEIKALLTKNNIQ